ncbi:10181_t:CDS:2 [Ambispora gerdemannii]|uniref:10181_t:CDS:1 n=1 Tax=Ambispora gerdemannii TaxID=144530 RepID=A0A9N8ZN04_9GLOM|nr:10181_t:CDS:2 [Ambispora gerdemannii]
MILFAFNAKADYTGNINYLDEKTYVNSIYVDVGSVTQFGFSLRLIRRNNDSPEFEFKFQEKFSVGVNNPSLAFVQFKHATIEPLVEIRYETIGLGSNCKTGGLYASVTGIFVVIFGSEKLSPWGIAQTTILCCTPCRRSLKKNLAKRYVSSAGIPLSEKVSKRPKDSSIEARLQILETLLREYVIDTALLDKVKKTLRENPKNKRNYEKSLLKYESEIYSSAIQNSSDIELE